MMEARRDLKMLSAAFEDVDRSHKPRNATLKPGTDEKMDCLLESPEGTGALTFIRWNWF